MLAMERITSDVVYTFIDLPKGERPMFSESASSIRSWFKLTCPLSSKASDVKLAASSIEAAPEPAVRLFRSNWKSSL